MFSFTANPFWRRWFGSRSERAASAFLRKLGYRIIQHNFRCEFGEMDIIAAEGSTIVFVEVRSTEQASTQMPALSVDRRKQERLTRLAVYYLKRNGLLSCSARMDVLAVSWPPQEVEPKITHYPNAFEATGRFQIFS